MRNRLLAQLRAEEISRSSVKTLGLGTAPNGKVSKPFVVLALAAVDYVQCVFLLCSRLKCFCVHRRKSASCGSLKSSEYASAIFQFRYRSPREGWVQGRPQRDLSRLRHFVNVWCVTAVVATFISLYCRALAKHRDKDGLVTTLRAPVGDDGMRPTLVVLIGDVAVHHPIVGDGPITIGRSPECDVQVEHASISRHHAIVHVGASFGIEDTGSANGTEVRGSKLSPNRTVPLALGELVDLGSTVLMIRLASSNLLVTHSTFLARLGEACRGASTRDNEFCVLRIHCNLAASSRVQQALSSQLGDDQALGRYGPAEFELLALNCKTEKGAKLRDRLLASLGSAEDELRIGLASYPRDGRTGHALLFAANKGTKPPVHTDGDKARAPIVKAEAMRELYGIVEKVSVGTISVLLLGETGVGKEVVARAVHKLSRRHDQSFVAINCAALSESLLESELFGHEKGAFTGAAASKMGLLESAHGGTVFLDEVGELPLSLQVKLLRALEERQVLRVGGLKPRDIDVRFVSATNRDLEDDVKTGKYRDDLLYRLNGVTLRIPPLREREQEIEAMARMFTDEAAVALGRTPPSLSAEALTLLRSHPWPGNIRELRNVVERAVLLAEEDIRSEHLPWHAVPPLAPATGAMTPTAVRVEESSDDVDSEEKRIRQALSECGGNQTRAAKLLGVSRRTLTRRLSHYDIARPLRDRDDE